MARKNNLSYLRRRRSKTYRKLEKRYRKERRARNKRLLKRYPFLKGVDWKGNPVNGYDYIGLWEDIPNGWTYSFGHLMCDDIMAEFKKLDLDPSEYYIEQAKEKYGQLRIYATWPREMDNIVDRYSRISENVCITCGKPNIPMLNTGWTWPQCKKCYEKLGFHAEPYEEIAPKDKSEWNISRIRYWRRFNSDIDGWEDHKEDISETVDKVIAEWNRRRPDESV